MRQPSSPSADMPAKITKKVWKKEAALVKAASKKALQAAGVVKKCGVDTEM